MRMELDLNWKPRRGRPPKPVAAPPELPRIPRIARLMALAIKFQGMIERGEVRDYADLARLGNVTRARITQVMNLLMLAPDIQESVLFGEIRASAMAERHLRGIVAELFWRDQRSRWTRVLRQNPLLTGRIKI